MNLDAALSQARSLTQSLTREFSFASPLHAFANIDAIKKRKCAVSQANEPDALKRTKTSSKVEIDASSSNATPDTADDSDESWKPFDDSKESD